MARLKTTSNNRQVLSAQSINTPAARRSYFVIIGAFLTMVESGILISSFGVFFKPVSNQFNWTRAETSGAFSLAVIISGITGLIAGRLGDRFGPRFVTVSLSFLSGLGYLLLSRTNSLWQLYLFYGVMVGIGIANVIPVTSLMARWYSSRRGLVTGITMSGTAIGAAIAPPIATQIIERYNWSLSYLIVGCAAIVLIMVSALLLRNPPPVSHTSSVDKLSEQTHNLKDQQFGLKQAARSLPFWIMCATFFCLIMNSQIINVHIIPAATDIGIATTRAATILSLTNVACIIGCFIFGTTNDRIGSKLSLVITLVVSSVATSLLLGAKSFGIFFLFAIIFGVGWGGVATLRPTVIAELFDIRSHGVTMGALFLISNIGGMIGPVVAGHIFDISGKYESVFQLVLLLNIIGLILALILKFWTARIKQSKALP